MLKCGQVVDAAAQRPMRNFSRQTSGSLAGSRRRVVEDPIRWLLVTDSEVNRDGVAGEQMQLERIRSASEARDIGRRFRVCGQNAAAHHEGDRLVDGRTDCNVHLFGVQIPAEFINPRARAAHDSLRAPRAKRGGNRRQKFHNAGT